MADSIPAQSLSKYLGRIVSLTVSPRMSSAINQWLQILAGELGKGFLSSRSPTGETWQPLKRKRPKGHNQGSRPLIDFGELLSSVVSTGDGHIEEVHEAAAVFGTDVDYARHHQWGAPRANIPARPFLGVSEEMADELAETVADELMSQIEGLY